MIVFGGEQCPETMAMRRYTNYKKIETWLTYHCPTINEHAGTKLNNCNRATSSQSPKVKHCLLFHAIANGLRNGWNRFKLHFNVLALTFALTFHPQPK